jgi:Domain of unknown function (DUF222)
MCGPGQAPPAPATAADAVAMARAGLGWLAAADVASLTTAEQADCLRGLERVESALTAARARVLGAFHARAGCADDGHGSTRAWLKWQARVTGGAAAGAMGWMRRLAAHPAVGDALAGAEISESWGRQICEWTDPVPEAHRHDADVILLGAAAGGGDLADLAGLAEEIRNRTAAPDTDGDDGFSDRGLRLATTFAGAGKLTGDLTPQCTAAVQAVLEALGKKRGPEDTRTTWQRRHDALEDAMRRLIASGCLPERAGQPTQIVLHLGLGQLRGLPGAAAAEAAWAGAAAAGAAAAGAAAGPGEDCDATIVPIVTGHIDPQILGRLAAASRNGRDADQGDGEADVARRDLVECAARQIIVARAAQVLSGPAGLAAYLRTGLLDGPAAAVSLPLDVGAATETIPAHLRRAVTARDRHCRFPGCDQPPAACQPHHIIPRSEGGPTCLTNLLTLCTFHHLIAVHRWGWGITLLPDGTVTATSPDRSRTLHSHGPPAHAA